MTVVLVHGNPETDAVWDPLVAELGRDDVLRLSPPGWGAPVPEGWGATVAEYRDWLVRQLEEIGAPVHLVGHDWGGGHVLGVAMTRPDLLRSWCSDILGCLEPDYVWHPLAQLWQTPGAGEAAVAAIVEDPGPRLDDMAARGLDRAVGERMAAGYDATMARCILGLYRDAAQPARSCPRRRPVPAWPCWPPRTTTWAPTSSAGARPAGPAPSSSRWTGSGTGGWCRTPRAAQRC